MKGSTHFSISFIAFILSYLAKSEAFMISSIASFAIDIDHLWLIIKEKAFTKEKIKVLFKNIHKKEFIKRYYVDTPYPLHSLEINLCLIIASCFFPPLLYVAIGFLFHSACDAIHHSKHKLPVWSWFFFTKYLTRNH